MSRGVQTENDATLGPVEEAELHLVAIEVGLRRGDSDRHLHVAEAAEARQGILYQLRLGASLCLVVQLLPAAAAADIQMAATAAAALRSRAQDFHGTRLDEVALHPAHLGADALAGERLLDEDDQAVVTG